MCGFRQQSVKAVALPLLCRLEAFIEEQGRVLDEGAESTAGAACKALGKSSAQHHAFPLCGRSPR